MPQIGLFNWFNAKSAKEFGALLAETFARSVTAEADVSEKKFSQKAESALRNMQRMVDQFKTAEKLNVYKKAQLGNSFKWRLKDLGYDDAYIDRLTEWLLERL